MNDDSAQDKDEVARQAWIDTVAIQMLPVTSQLKFTTADTDGEDTVETFTPQMAAVTAYNYAEALWYRRGRLMDRRKRALEEGE